MECIVFQLLSLNQNLQNLKMVGLQAELLQVLESLCPEDWQKPTVCGSPLSSRQSLEAPPLNFPERFCPAPEFLAEHRAEMSRKISAPATQSQQSWVIFGSATTLRPGGAEGRGNNFDSRPAIQKFASRRTP
jgi:hypothetical protein